MTVGDKIRYYREKQKITQEDLAALSHISVSAIRKYESNIRSPKNEQIEKLAIALHIPASALRVYELDSISEILPVLHEILLWGDVRFNGEKNDDGTFIEDTVSISFSNDALQRYLKNFADRNEEIESLRSAANSTADSSVSELLEQKVNELKNNSMDTFILDQILDTVYYEFDLPTLQPFKDAAAKTSRLVYFDQFIEVMIQLAYSSLDFEYMQHRSFGDTSFLVVTFDEDDLIDDNLPDEIKKLFGSYLLYIDSLIEYGIKIEKYAYKKNTKTYYRYKIQNKQLVSSVDIIERAKNASNGNYGLCFDQEELDMELASDIKLYHIPISEYV